MDTESEFYLIECYDDRSYCIVAKNDILFDESIEIGMEVQFFYNKKTFCGKVIKNSSKYFIYHYGMYSALYFKTTSHVVDPVRCSTPYF